MSSEPAPEYSSFQVTIYMKSVLSKYSTPSRVGLDKSNTRNSNQ
ncbi:MAG: hypothetical protein ACE1YX_00210 [Nitrosopumilaceae archaeon]